jgi:hypothetical protein
VEAGALLKVLLKVLLIGMHMVKNVDGGEESRNLKF